MNFRKAVEILLKGGMGKEEIAYRIGCTVATIENWRSGRVRNPQAAHLRGLGRLVGSEVAGAEAGRAA